MDLKRVWFGNNDNPKSAVVFVEEETNLVILNAWLSRCDYTFLLYAIHKDDIDEITSIWKKLVETTLKPAIDEEENNILSAESRLLKKQFLDMVKKPGPDIPSPLRDKHIKEGKKNLFNYI